MSGLRPIVEIMYMDFTPMAMDQIVSQAAKWRYMTGGQVTVPLTIRTQGGAGWQSGAQHATMVEAWFTHVPGLKVVMPSQPDDAQAAAQGRDPRREPGALHRAPRLLPAQGRGADDEEQSASSAGARLREGTDVTVVRTRRRLSTRRSAADKLEAEEQGISVEVIDPRTLQPLDMAWW